MEKRELAKQIYFTKEAADFLGISVQRLNQIVQNKKIHPLKKSKSGTLFLLSDLIERKKEQDIFEERNVNEGERGMFTVDNEVKQEALNFATVMLITGMTEKKAEVIFENVGQRISLFEPMIDRKVILEYSNELEVSENEIIYLYKKAEDEFSMLQKHDVIIKRGSPRYSKLLQQTEEAPRFLYLRGNVSLLAEKNTVSLVGSRKASKLSQASTRRLAKFLGENGITVISGLARGIDVNAHLGVLSSGYNTISVIGTNLNQYYPKENKSVQIMIERQGLVVSQFAPSAQTQRWFFPTRNGVMSGMSLATVIMEAGETSGSLKQADYALKQGRLVIIPKSAINNPNITWPKRYVERGAKVANNSHDIVSILADNKVLPSRQQSWSNLINYNQEEQDIHDVEIFL